MSFRYGRAEGPTLGLDHEVRPVLEATPEFWAEQRRQIRGQLEELLTKYGRIDLLWFDGAAPEVRESASVDWVRSLQPQIVVNPRLWGVGDFETPECRVPEKRPAGWWEMCHSWHANGWGLQPGRAVRGSTEWVLDLLAKAATWGGNLLINVSPRPDGTLPDSLYAKMAEGAEWMKTHGKAIFESEAGPYPERCNVPVTVAPGKWYVFVGPGYTGSGDVEGRGQAGVGQADGQRPRGGGCVRQRRAEFQVGRQSAKQAHGRHGRSVVLRRLSHQGAGVRYQAEDARIARPRSAA